MKKPVPMTDKDGLREMPFRLNRRQIISGMAALGALAGGPIRTAYAQKRVIIPEGDFAPLPIAIPNFVAGTARAGGVGGRRAPPRAPHTQNNRGAPPPVPAALP